MDGMPPSDRPASRQLPQPAGAQWLTEFMRREGIADDRGPPGADVPPDEPAEKSYRGWTLLGAGVLVAIGLVAAVALHRRGIDQAPGPMAPATVALGLRKPVPVPATGNLGASAPSGFPQQPVEPPPSLLSHWAGTLIIPAPPIRPAVAPAPAKVAPPAAPPAGTGMYLRVVYAPADAAEGARIDALTARLQSENPDIASATAAAGPAAGDGVAYFFPDDRAGASRIAASLARMTKRPEPVVLVHAKALPRPGSIDIRLPTQDEKDLNNEGS
jgi:hypothetical protein